MANKTGQYTGAGSTPKTVQTGLGSVRIVNVYKLPSGSGTSTGTSPSGYGGQTPTFAHTSDQIQAMAGNGAFMGGATGVGNGLALDGGRFIVTNADLNQAGATYCYEAWGD